MKRNTIKWRIFKYNLIIIFVLIVLTTIIFNMAVRVYIEKDVIGQLNKIASRTEDTALEQGPDFFPKSDGSHTPPPPLDMQKSGPQNSNPPSMVTPGNYRQESNTQRNNTQGSIPQGGIPQSDNLQGGSGTVSDPNAADDGNNNELYRFFFRLDRSLREPLSVLNANFILLDNDKKAINPYVDDYIQASDELMSKITAEVSKAGTLNKQEYVNFHLYNTEYVAIIKPVGQKNTFGLGWIVIYSSLQKVNQLQWVINTILLAILVFSALITVMFSSLAAKKISSPFSSLNEHIRAIAERNFDTKIHLPVDDELQDFVNNINVLSEKLETYDQAQKTFLQNASHEFRTPLMSIQSYAEGIKYDVVDSSTAVDVIVDEAKRMTHLVEDLLYLSRLDSIEENYRFTRLDYNTLIHSCVERMNGIAIKNNIVLNAPPLNENVEIQADEEKLSRAVTNLISNCIRYARSTIVIASRIIDGNKLELTISDDGPGFDPSELPHIFERFFKGKKGNFGLGLAISKNVIERHRGKINASNSGSGAVFTIELPLGYN